MRAMLMCCPEVNVYFMKSAATFLTFFASEVFLLSIYTRYGDGGSCDDGGGGGGIIPLEHFQSITTTSNVQSKCL